MPGALCVEGSAFWQFSCVCRVVCIAGSESFLGVVLVVVLQHVGCHENTTQHKQQQGTDDRNSGGAGRHTNTPTHTDQPHKTQHKQPGTHQQSQTGELTFSITSATQPNKLASERTKNA